MIDIQGPGSIKKMSGRTEKGKVKRIPDLLFARKHLTRSKEEKKIKKIKHLFAFVSSPHIYRDKDVVAHAKAWCHALRNPEKILPKKPHIFLPESDFMDPQFIYALPPRKHKRYDFFYFTLNSRAGIKNKGLKIFCDCVHTLCNDMKLRGLVVVYFPNVPRRRRLRLLDVRQRQQLANSGNRLTFYWGKMNYVQMAELAAECKFGFFPNTVDNSPRTIPETLIRDVPVLVNEEIHGGWHYINQNTGELFNKLNLKEKVKLIVKRKRYSPRDYFLRNYGFKKSSKKLAEFVQSVVKLDEKYTHMYFNNYEECLGNI